MANWKKLAQGAAGAAGAGGGLNVEDVFSTYLYDGTSSSQTITNNIDLSGEGGLVWIKSRTNQGFHFLFDTERGALEALSSEITNGEITRSGSLTAFNSNGFSVGSFAASNGSGEDYASWTFRKAPKFFDVVTYTGDGTSSRQISHDLGTTVGMTVVKCTSNSQYWHVLHRSGNAAKTLYLNRTDAEINDTYAWNSTHATSTHFTIGAGLNTSGRTYVAYLFAHNDGDGEFGPDGDKDIIKCGSFEGSATTVSLGFEPQWLLFKNIDTNSNWAVYDVMRGMVVGGVAQELYPNLSNAEGSGGIIGSISVHADGFSVTGGYASTYIYMAIRRGPMAVPESATDVFAIDTRGGTSPSPPELTSGFVTDFLIYPNNINTTNDKRVLDRLRGKEWLYTNKTNAETPVVGEWDYMDGHGAYSNVDSNDIGYMWRRAPNFFDVVAYTGNGTAGRTVSHNLGAAPEMMWIKSRNVGSTHWVVYHSGLGNDKFAYLSATNAAFNDASPTAWDFTTPSSADFTLGAQTGVNQSGYNYIAYLFASLDGVSKVGSYTGNGNTEQNIDCGFSSGARFVLIKKSSHGGSWFLFDSERGIISGNSPYLQLNQTAAESSSYNELSPYSSGFTVRNGGGLNLNFNGHTFIFYAIA